MKVHPRFAALANGISIHADDFDDTGSALHVAGARFFRRPSRCASWTAAAAKT